MRKYDVDLDRRDIQQLSEAEEIAAFFARLGYSTDARIEQTAQNLGITAEGARRPIKHIWLIADEDTFLQVYLFELKSVTMTNIRELARAFRNKAGNYLFVLTSEYKQLDFVLIERIAPTAASDRIAIKQSGVRARVLTVDRTDPGTVAIRVLRRFTYTEYDPFYQYEKLLSAYSIADWSEEYFNNRALFSDYFLKNRLQARPEWSEDPKPAYKRLKEIYKESLSKYLSEREVKIRSELYEPTFKKLGFKYETGKAATDPAHERPDYYLYSPHQKQKQDKPIAVALVYPWGRSLDGKDDRRDKDTPEENPGAAVVSLLEADQAPWAIVTNGQTWRLYSQKTHSRATNYYEIDLIEALSLGSPAHTDPAQAFRYYWIFFRCEAFEKKEVVHEGKEVEQSFLDQVLVGSEEYAKELGERLKDRIFEQIFPRLAGGFIADIRAKEGKDATLPKERLDQIFQGTLTLLYRLLFLLYAESRDLLPAKEVRGYYQASIKKLKEEMAEAAGTIEDEAPLKLSKRYRPDEYEIQHRLTRLFEVIDWGDEKMNVPVYNGGLFVTNPADDDESSEAANSRFLRDHAVPDRYLVQAIDLMARDVDDKRQDLVFIDYKSLGVRQLGSMYEGLLEFRLCVAPSKMGIVKGKKTEEIIPYKEAVSKKRKILTEGRGRSARERTLSKGTVYLENDRRERKATGSYYTPGHIVKYIVEHAVGPVLKEKLETLRPKLREVEQKRRAFEDRQKAFQHRGLKPEPEEKKKLIGRELVDEIFNIRVLDPAMGSGHFLVQSVDLITDKMIDFLNSFPVNPVRDFLEKTRETILNEMEDQGITIDVGRLTDVNLLKRHVLKRCIYGVDLNPMAVELAKVSLWLDCFTLGAPLSFLDHHFRYGNSLIGVTVEEVREATEKGQYGLFGLLGSRFTGLMLATNLMRDVAELPDVTSKDVSESRKRYKEATDALAPFKRILDVYASCWFGNEQYRSGKGRKKVTHEPAKEFLRSQEAETWLKDPESAKLSDWGRRIADTAARAAFEIRFFHWELEFPEVFYGPRPGTERVIERLEGAGFDAVVGNPPYGMVLESKEKRYFEITYETTAGRFDRFELFFEKGIELSNEAGYTSFIVPSPILTNLYSKRLRSFMLTKCHIKQIINFGMDVFEDPTIHTCILLLSTRIENEPKVRIRKKVLDFARLTEDFDFELPQNNLGNNECASFDIFIDPGLYSIVNRMSRIGIPLGEKFYIRQCIKTGNDKLYVQKSDVPLPDPWKPSLQGRGIGRYVVHEENLYVKYGEWLARNWKNKSFYEVEKIAVRETGARITAAIDINNRYFLSSLYSVYPKDPEEEISLYYLLGILNSTLANFYMKIIALELTQGAFTKIRTNQLSRLPICMDFDTGNKKNKYNEIIDLVKKTIQLNEDIHQLLNKEEVEIQKELDNVDERIDSLVYNIYELSFGEKKRIEGFIE